MSLSPIMVNNQILDPQPTTVSEYKIRNDSEQEALDQTLQRNTIVSPTNPTGRKFMAELSFQTVTPAQFQGLEALFTSGSGIYYVNPGSKYGTLTMSGLPYVSENEPYVPGESLLTDYKVKIRQI